MDAAVTSIDVLDYKGLAVKIASARVRRWPGESLEDLVQEGMLGIMHAKETYDPTRGSFSTYAYWWANERITKYLFDKTRTVQMPSCIRKRRTTAEKAGIVNESVSFDTPMEGGETLLSVFASGSPNPEETAYEQELWREVDRLPKHQQAVLRLHFVLEKTCEEIAPAFGVTRQRVHQILQAALATLRKRLSKEPR